MSETITTRPRRRTASRGHARPRAASPGRCSATGVIAGPFYIVVSLAQALTRDGFDLDPARVEPAGQRSRRAGSRCANFVLTGLMVIAAAVGFRRALGAGPAARGRRGCSACTAPAWSRPGVFPRRPDARVPGRHPGRAARSSHRHGTLHIAVGGVGFLAPGRRDLRAGAAVPPRRATAAGRVRPGDRRRVPGGLRRHRVRWRLAGGEPRLHRCRRARLGVAEPARALGLYRTLA